MTKWEPTDVPIRGCLQLARAVRFSTDQMLTRSKIITKMEDSAEKRVLVINTEMEDSAEKRVPVINTEMEDSTEKRVLVINIEMEDSAKKRVPVINT